MYIYMYIDMDMDIDMYICICIYIYIYIEMRPVGTMVHKLTLVVFALLTWPAETCKSRRAGTVAVLAS